MGRRKDREIWVFIDRRNERHFNLSLQVMAKARRLARTASAKTAAVIAGDSGKRAAGDALGCLSVDEASRNCLSHGADRVYLFDHSKLEDPRADLYAPVMSNAVASASPLLFLFALTDFGRELAARIARLRATGLIADCIDLTYKDGDFIAACPSWGGEILAEITYAGEFQDTGFATVQPQGIQPVETQGVPGTVERIAVRDLATPRGVKLLSRAYEAKDRKRLEDAQVVVVGGAGLGSADGFSMVRELAAALGGDVGATRPPILQHWVTEDRLIGQTGKRIRPRLLLSAGTSGAVQYTAGIMESGTIMAVNRDPNAPIFQVADVGIVADAATFLPVLTAKVKQVLMRTLADTLQEVTQEGERPLSGFGEKLLKLRESQGWTRESLAQATGQSPESIEQFEKDEISPSVAFLLRLSRALKIDPSTFLHESEKTVIKEQRAQQFTKRTQNYSYQTLTPGAVNEHLRSFMVTIDPRQVHKPVAYKHEGEEFIYVMEGELELILGGRPHKLKPHESIHFNSETPHKLKSISDEPTRCLVVLYTP
ncbi:MAG: FAD-binding protein [Deltaproteobacteria bacterium]|nr:FAD-binding protein [Deltaproteobacteria bacterium]